MFKNLAAVTALAVCGVAQAQVREAAIPTIVKKDGRFALMVDGAPFLMLGAQCGNSSAWPATLPKVWPAIEYLHANTLEIPIYWEQFEPAPGRFDYTVIDTIITQAREHHVRLVLLWFGTWKNGSQHYMPEWMKLDPAKYFHVVNKEGRAVDSPSPFAKTSLEADIRAFSAFMAHLKAFDPQRTVILVQVENEPGTWGTLRDYSPEAQKLFDGAVPASVLKAMGKPVDRPMNWAAAFGAEADVCFHAWSVASYMNKVAAAGKAAYPLPIYANAALRDPFNGPPGTYESGGPTDNVIPIYKAAAPAIDIVAPDIYMSEPDKYLKVLELYRREDNALFVPETSGSNIVSRFFFSALGLGAIGFSPFGLDYTHEGLQLDHIETSNMSEANSFLEPTAENYRLIAPMMRDVARLNFEGKVKTAVEEKGRPVEMLQFRNWMVTVTYGAWRNRPPRGNPEPTGRALIAQTGENSFLVAGLASRVDFQPADKAKSRQYLKVEEGMYENGAFRFLRILNGDETDWGMSFGAHAEPRALRVSVATY